ncbi:SKU5 similar 2 [Actinidia rufa]|uniref:SKU5 similar 2 n=1 Tax=Actinidia rufa TaxID=165716 RepID=A0A7J0ED48_9ERIC|nr:SKU5 similar 2 [Actinidia rufa]
MAYGEWTENSKGTYDKWDAISRCTTQVVPGGWTAVLVSLDNVGAWNLRAENLDRWYLGQETYLRIINPDEDNTTEFAAPDNVLYCGALSHLQKYNNLTCATKEAFFSINGHWTIEAVYNDADHDFCCHINFILSFPVK